MSDRCARVTLLLALVPLVFGTWTLVVAADVDAFRAPSLTGTLLAITAAIVIWRKYVRWTVIRSLSTGGLTLAVLMQVILWHPLWAIQGCGMDDYLRTAQSLGGLGLWWAACALLWWGAVLVGRHRRSDSATTAGRLTMSPNAVRLAVGLALVPFLPGLFFLIMLALEDFGPGNWTEELKVGAAYEVCALLAILVWRLAWRRVVPWTRKRRIVTLALDALLLASPVCVLGADSLFAGSALHNVGSAFLWLAPVFAWALWLAGTAWAWRSDRLRGLPGLSEDATVGGPAWCPQCGYSLMGLHEVRCPECGWASTVDDIVARSITRALAVP